MERALKVLDGAILVLCSVAGVQSQSITVDRQMKRYNVPRIAFVNKCDRSGANPARVTEQLREKLKHNAVMMQIPIGLEDKHEGVVDLVTMKAYRFEGDNGENIVEGEIPAGLQVEAEARREVMLDAVSMFSDELMEAILEETVTEDLIHEAVRKRCAGQRADAGLHGQRLQEQGCAAAAGRGDALPARRPPTSRTPPSRCCKGGEEEEFILSNSDRGRPGLPTPSSWRRAPTAS